jgi:hypothetical protein
MKRWRAFQEVCETIPDNGTKQKPVHTSRHCKRIVCVDRAKVQSKSADESSSIQNNESFMTFLAGHCKSGKQESALPNIDLISPLSQRSEKTQSDGDRCLALSKGTWLRSPMGSLCRSLSVLNQTKQERKQAKQP